MNEYTIFENTLQAWGLAISLVILLFLIFVLIRRIIRGCVLKWAAKSSNKINDYILDLLEKTKKGILLLFAIYLSSTMIQLPESLSDALKVITFLVFLLQVGFWLNATINFAINRRLNRQNISDGAQATTWSALGALAKGVLWTVLCVMALDNIPGVEVSTLIAGLGIGGIAIGLAVQNILGDLLASLSIVLDRPFVIGDTILVGDLMGTVEHIGIKSTRLRSLSGEQLIFSNSDLLASIIRNYQRMDRRRVVLELSVTYQTTHDQLSAIPELLKSIIAPIDGITFDRAHFKAYGDSALKYEVVYWIENSDYRFYMDQQQEINLAIFDAFESRKINFAYPTHTVFFERTHI
jgi:small-conductance mechanosensitive channel